MSPSLDACLKKAGVKLSREHRAFLGDHATSLPVDDDHPPPPRAGAKAKAGAAPVWAKDVSVLFGANDLVKQLTQKKDDIGFWDRRLNRFAVAIGRCFDGDVLVQVSGGRHVGHIVRISHDEYDELFARLRKADQRVDALLDDDLEGTERIARSFNQFYEALLRAFRPLKPPGRDVTITRLDYSAQAFAITDEQTYILGARIKSVATWQFCVLRMRPRGKPKAGARAEGFWNQQPTMCALGNRVLFAAGGGLYVSSNDGPAKQLPVGPHSSRVRTDITGVGADGNGGAWALARVVTSDSKGSSSDETDVLGLFWSKDGVRFVAVKWPDGDDVLFDIVGRSANGLLVNAHGRLYLLGPRRTIKLLGRPERDNPIVAATITSAGTLLAKMWLGITEMRRSTNGGKIWRRLQVKDPDIRAMHCTSTGTVVLAGKKLWVSRDDGETFAPLPVRLRGTVDVLGETGGELLVGAGDLYRLPAP
jgi:hypothetical protein